jgi:hypothetical protein
MTDEQSNCGLLAGYLPESEMARELGRNPRTLMRWRQERTGPPVTFVGKTPMYNEESAKAWLKGQERKPRR